jgi:ribose transport system substrate-binding protein
MATGVLTAVSTANPENWPLISGEARSSYLKQWVAILEERPEFTSIGVVNPPGVGADGVRVAIELLMGTELNEEALSGPFGNTLYVPIPYAVTSENLAQIYEEQGIEETADSYTLDGLITQEEAQQLLAGEIVIEENGLAPVATEEAGG